MKKGGLGGALLLAAAAIVTALLLMDRARPADRAPRKAVPVAEPPKPPPPAAVVEEPPPPNEPPTSPKSGARLVGRVTDEDGRPVADAGIWLTKGRGPGEGEIVTRTGDDGRYLVDGVDGEERMVGAIAAKFAPSDLKRIEPASQAVFEIDFSLRRGGGTLALAFGDAESADVFIEPVFLESPESGGRRYVEVRGKSNVLVHGLVPEWSFVRVRAAGYAPQTLLTRVPPEGSIEETRVPLGQGAVVFGNVRTPAGTPAAGARIDIVGWEWAGIGVVADAEGRYRMERAPASLVELRAAGADEAEARNLVRLQEGEACSWDPVLQAPAEIAGRVVDDAGTPVRASLTCRPVGSLRPSEIVEVDATGAFRIPGLPNREHRIAAWWPGWSGKVPPAAEVTALPGGPPITITLPRADGALRGVIATRDGLPAAGATVRTWPSGAPGKEVRARAAADGTFLLGPLPAGTYFLELHLDGEPTLHLDGFEVAAGETRDVGVLRFAGGGRVSVRILDADGKVVPVPGIAVAVASFDGGIRYNVARQGDAFVSEELVPGRYLASGGMAGIIEEAEAVAGETTNIDLKLRGGGILEAVALREDGSRTMADFDIRDTAGHRIDVADGPVNPLRVQLANGWYLVAATDGTGAHAFQGLRIPADGTETKLALALGMPMGRR